MSGGSRLGAASAVAAASQGGSAHVAASSSAVRQVLVELEQLLEGERAALVCLDRDAIEVYAARKLELDAALQEAVKVEPLAASDKELLERIRQAALKNQLLLAHARSCVQGVLSLLTPGSAPVYSAPGYAPTAHGAGAHTSPSPPPIALNLRR